MMVQAAAVSVNVAWITVIGTLGGVVVTALLRVVTALLTQRSQYRRTEQEHRFQVERELRTAQRDSYVRYIVSAQNVFDRAAGLYVKNRAEPLDIGEFVLHPSQHLAEVLARNETCRVEALQDLHDLDSRAGEHRVERLGELTRPVPDQEPEPASPLSQVH